MSVAACFATRFLKPIRLLTTGLVCIVFSWTTSAFSASDIDRDPINYTKTQPDNVISHLQEQLTSGKKKLTYAKKLGYLGSLLEELKVPLSSQVLVFSKTSLQRDLISPKAPRALYFNDEVYIGACRGGAILEIGVADPKLGAVFYVLEQEAATSPRFQRQADSCLICHASSQNDGFPGFLVRSVYPDKQGLPLLSMGSHHTTHTSPLEERWGGWYVTGTSGKQTHLGNLILEGRAQTGTIDNRSGANVTSLERFCRLSSYLSSHSDLVALMVLEHQSKMQNLLTRANFLTRMAIRDRQIYDKALGRSPDELSESFLGRIKDAGEQVLRYMLFCEEVRLTDSVRGTSTYAVDFAKAGPRDSRGRSLRDFDLQTRVFKYPCSYLIYSESFDALPGAVKIYILKRLDEVLSGADQTPAFAHLTTADRQAIREILLTTKPSVKAAWQSPK
jgi:hypothetical protein